jgi:hypothetical protein
MGGEGEEKMEGRKNRNREGGTERGRKVVREQGTGNK